MFIGEKENIFIRRVNLFRINQFNYEDLPD